MFSVIFEVRPKPQEWDTYLAEAKMLRPELEQVDGFIDNIRYRSLTRDGWILSLSGWRDEKAVVRWRTGPRHHAVLEKGRSQILGDYRLRVGEITQDTARRPEQWAHTANPDDCAEFLGLNPYADGMASYDVFDAVLSPGDLILLCAWRDNAAAEAFETGVPGPIPPGGRRRRVRVIRDYGMFDRREAPQYYPDVAR